MNRRMCRQVLDCGDGVREVTALAVKLLKILKRAAHTATTTQSGDSEDSVAAVQDAGATNPPPCGHGPDAGSKERGGLPMTPRLPPMVLMEGLRSVEGADTRTVPVRIVASRAELFV